MGKFIVIEGLDGSGKTTQTALLADYLRKKGKVRELSFPRYGEKSCSLVEMYLGGELGSDPDDTNGYAASCFFAADRYISYVSDWKRDYEDPECTVLATRYTTSNAYHQLSKLPEDKWEGFLGWIFDFEFTKLGLPRPDSVILLSMAPSLSAGNVKSRSAETGQKMDIHEKDAEYLLRSYKAAGFAAERCGWHKIECAPNGKMLERSEIFNMIKASLNI